MCVTRTSSPALYPAGTAFADGSEGAIDVFYFPDINGDGPVLTAGTIAAGFDDDPATMAVMEYLATGEYAENRQAEQTAELDGSISGFLSAPRVRTRACTSRSSRRSWRS